LLIAHGGDPFIGTDTDSDVGYWAPLVVQLRETSGRGGRGARLEDHPGEQVFGTVKRVVLVLNEINEAQQSAAYETGERRTCARTSTRF